MLFVVSGVCCPRWVRVSVQLCLLKTCALLYCDENNSTAGKFADEAWPRTGQGMPYAPQGVVHCRFQPICTPFRANTCSARYYFRMHLPCCCEDVTHVPGPGRFAAFEGATKLYWTHCLPCPMSWLYTAFRPGRGKTDLPSRRWQRVFFICVWSLLLERFDCSSAAISLRK